MLRRFTFSPAAIAAIRARLRGAATTFEALTAALWRARAAALRLAPEEDASLLFYYNVRAVRELGLPAGYYGNAVTVLAAPATSGELLSGSLGDAVARIREAKAAVTAASVRCAPATDLIVLRQWSDWARPNAFRVSDVRNARLRGMDYGWGQPVYRGRADTHYEVSFLYAVQDDAGGDNAVDVSFVLPRPAMDRFASEIQTLLVLPPLPQPRL